MQNCEFIYTPYTSFPEVSKTTTSASSLFLSTELIWGFQSFLGLRKSLDNFPGLLQGRREGDENYILKHFISSPFVSLCAMK